MKLIPKAKPVRIRIKSGGIEHSSINSLREHFNFDDIFPLCQNDSMLRWLEQQNETLVLERLKSALAGDTNKKEKYRLNIVLSFLPDAVSSGVKDINSLLLYWAKKKDISNINSFLGYVNDKEVLHTLLKNIDDDSGPIKKRLGMLYFDSGDLQAAVDLGYEEAILTLKNSLPSWASQFSSKDVTSFLMLKKKFKNIKSSDLAKFTKPVKDCALLLSLIQEIISRSDEINILTDYLAMDDNKLISEKKWPDFLMPYVTYTLWAYRKYVGNRRLVELARSFFPKLNIYYDSTSGCIGFFTTSNKSFYSNLNGLPLGSKAQLNLSNAQSVLFREFVFEGSPLLNGLSKSSIDHLRNIKLNNSSFASE